MTNQQPKIVVVGGSLAGLTLALACAARGVPVHVVERSTRRVNGGDSLSVDLEAIAKTVGHDPRLDPRLPVVRAYRDRYLTTWPALYAWLYERVQQTPGVILEEGKSVTAVTDLGGQVHINFANRSSMVADAVVGADGYNSAVRKAITPEAPLARYAGYLVWRGLVEEKTLSRPVAWASDGGLWIEFVGGYRLVAGVLPGRDGSMEVGKRQITFAWFDVHRENLLRETGCLTDDGFIVGTLGRGTIDIRVQADLLGLIPQIWPTVWAEAVAEGIRARGALSGAPISEYKPDHLAHGALAIVGDAAHVVSPMTGSGFATSVDDAAVLAHALAQRSADEPLSLALARYEDARLPYIRGLVNHSRRISAEYVHHAFMSADLVA